MKRGLERTTVGNGMERDGAFLSTAMSPSSYCNTSVAINGSNISQYPNGVEGCCLGGWISSLLGGGEEQDPLTRAAAAPAPAPNDAPTALVAEELNKLSLKEREIVYEDLHGVSMVEDESNEELVNKRLNEMKLELEKIPRSKKVAYLIAMEEFSETGKEFCQDRNLQLMFLRADRWDSKKAALRFVGWLDWKLELFGRDVLCHRHVTMDKLEKDAQKTVQGGRLQILPQRDTSGRTVLFDWFGRHSEVRGSVKSNDQVFWYMLMATVEDDIQSQRMGIVYILYTIGGTPSMSADDRKTFWDCSNMLPMLPIRTNCIHYCFKDSKLGPVIKLIQTALPSHMRARFRSHEGNHTEVRYSLMTYGLPTTGLPVTTDGNMKKTNHIKWFRRRKARDSTLANRVGGGRRGDMYGIDLPGRFDILFGEGKPFQRHMGNRRLQDLVSMHYQEYDTASRGDKQLIAEKVATLPILAGQGRHAAPRFLKRRDDGWWAPVSHKEAIEKVCMSFRSYRSSNIDKVCRSIRAFRVSKKGSTTMTNATRPTTTTTVVDNDETGEIPNPVSTSSSTTGGSGPTAAAAAAKRVKVETPNVLDSENLMLQISSDPSLSIWKEEDEDLNSLYDATTTTKEDSLLDLDGSDWDNNWDVL